MLCCNQIVFPPPSFPHSPPPVPNIALSQREAWIDITVWYSTVLMLACACKSDASIHVCMQKLRRGHTGGQMMAGSMQVNVVFLKGVCMLIRIAMLMCCLTWHLATCYSPRHGSAFQRYASCCFMPANYSSMPSYNIVWIGIFQSSIASKVHFCFSLPLSLPLPLPLSF